MATALGRERSTIQSRQPELGRQVQRVSSVAFENGDSLT